MRLPGELNCLYQGRRQEQQAEGSVPCEPKVPPLPWICTPVPVKPTFPTQNLLCQPHCCAAARFSHLPANRHQTQRARSRFFYGKTTCSCLKVRFNTENCKNEKISLKNRNQVQKKVNTTATGEKWCTKVSTQKKPFCTCKVARSQTPSLAFLLPPRFVGVQSSSLLQEQYSSFHSAGTPSGSKTSKNSLNSALLQWASLRYTSEWTLPTKTCIFYQRNWFWRYLRDLQV